MAGGKNIDTSVVPYEKSSVANPPSAIMGYVSVESKGGTSVFDASVQDVVENFSKFRAKKANRKKAEKALESMGFEIIAKSRMGFAVAGPAAAYEELTGGKVEAFERLVQAEGGQSRYSTHFDIVGEGQPSCKCLGAVKTSASHIEGVAIEEPKVLHGLFPAPLPPNVAGDYLRVPDDVGAALGAAGAHRAGHYGEGVDVAMVDSGKYAHPFFDFHTYDVRPTITVVPGTDPAVDPNGHGTGESANIFALAPGISLQSIRASSDPTPSGPSRLVGAMTGFMRARQGNPDILTNSWGSDRFYPPLGGPSQVDLQIAAEIADTVDQGIFVVFSAGNGQFSIYPQVPGVFAAGGVFMERNLDLTASDYASGYPSPPQWFPGTVVPDACGLVGMRPRALYIMLPVPSGSELDILLSNVDPNSGASGDGTTTTDGWARFSGTSAAAPQVAGAAALILGAKPGLAPAQITEALTSTATDVTAGRCHPRFNNPATIGQDNATGFGLVNASAALEYAMSTF